MSPSEVDRAVARATGESVTQIRKLGFHVLRVGRRFARRRRRQTAPRSGTPSVPGTTRSR
jgi:hypothetical protein